jgi:hypothetical protein
MAIADVPKHGWLLYAPATGEHLIVSGNLDSLARSAENLYLRTSKKFPDACLIHCFELGRKMAFGLRPVIESLEPVEGET